MKSRDRRLRLRTYRNANGAKPRAAVSTTGLSRGGRIVHHRGLGAKLCERLHRTVFFGELTRGLWTDPTGLAHASEILGGSRPFGRRRSVRRGGPPEERGVHAIVWETGHLLPDRRRGARGLIWCCRRWRRSSRGQLQRGWKLRRRWRGSRCRDVFWQALGNLWSRNRLGQRRGRLQAQGFAARVGLGKQDRGTLSAEVGQPELADLGDNCQDDGDQQQRNDAGQQGAEQRSATARARQSRIRILWNRLTFRNVRLALQLAPNPMR